MQHVKHILVTKFNCNLILGNKVLQEKGFTKKLDENWLRYRWQLFTTFTVPSICAQTNTNFDWVVFFDKHSPQWLREEALKINVPCRKRFSFYDVGSDEFFDAFKNLNDPASYDIALTTIIDSDDAFHRYAMQRIRERFEKDPDNIEVINFEIGYQYDTASQRLAIIQVSSPPFSTKINVANQPNPFNNSIFYDGGDHTKLPGKHKDKYCEISEGDPMFIQVVHGDNMANRLQWNAAYLPRYLSNHILKNAFNIKISLQNISIHYYSNDIKHYLRQLKNNLLLQLKHRREDLI